jgi:hypothetical protein
MRFRRAHYKGELKNQHFYIRIINERVKLTTSSLSFLTSLLVQHQSNLLFDYNSGIWNVIRVWAEWKSFNAKLNITLKNIYVHEMITGYKSFFSKTFLVEVLNNYMSARKGNPCWAHQEVSTHKCQLQKYLSPAIGEIKPWVLNCT